MTELDAAYARARAILDIVGPESLGIYADFDADGLSAAATLARGVEARRGVAPRGGGRAGALLTRPAG